MLQKDNYPLLHHNTFGIDVKASRYIEYNSVEELQSILSSSASLLTQPVLHIGGGSNLLFTKDYEGTVLHSAIKNMYITKDEGFVYVKAGSGVVWDDFVFFCVENGWQGAENLSIIPGEVGASAIQNIGAYGVEVKDLITHVGTMEVATGKARTFENAECQYSYRSSIFKHELKGKYIVTSVTFRLRKTPEYNLSYGLLKSEVQKRGETSIQNIREAVIFIRESKLPDPAIAGNAGSFFMNPVVSWQTFEQLKNTYPYIPHYIVSDNDVKIPAGWLIEQCGWKGKQIGNVAVHDKQALVIVNKGNATGEEIVRFSQQIQASVKEQFGIEIIPEVTII